jgi:L-threonylcarbamoyladenylate synthase
VSASAQVIARTAGELARGQVVVVPTDTVYGLAARPDRPEAVTQIFELKGRSDNKPLPVLGASVESLTEVVSFDARVLLLAVRFWPGALTLVLPRAAGFTHDLGTDKRGSVAVRVPQSETMLDLLAVAGPLAVTSANRSGEPPALTVDDARRVFGDSVSSYVDGGSCSGEPSTVVSLVGDLLVLRTGPISEDEIRQTLTP